MALLVAAIAIFIVGNLYRILRILRMPAHLRWELYPLPHGPRDRQSYGGSYFQESEWWTKPAESSRFAELRYMFAEVFFLKGVWKNFRALWLWSWLLHIGLYALVGAAVLGSLMQFAATAIAASGWAMAALQALSCVAMSAGLAGTLGLLVLRATSQRLRPYSSRGVLLNLGVIAALFGTGLAGLILEPSMVAEMSGVLATLLGRSEAPALSAMGTAHLSVVAIFLAYFPFTHMTHAYMKFFTYHSVRWDDAPAATDLAAQRSVAESLGRTVSWTAPHVAGGGTRTWREIVSAERSKSEAKP